MKKPRFCRGAVGMSNSFIGRRESNPHPEIFSCSFYTLSPRFKVRLGGLPGTGSLVGYPVKGFLSFVRATTRSFKLMPSDFTSLTAFQKSISI